MLEMKTESEDHKATFEDVVCLLAGKQSKLPPWLAGFLESWSASIHWRQHVEKIQPTRVKIKAQLNRLKFDASQTRKALHDAETLEALQLLEGSEFSDFHSLSSSLSRLISRIDVALKSDRLLTPGGVTKPGRSIPNLHDYIAPKLFCTAIIAETYAFFHNGKLPRQSPNANAAVNAFWFAAGGPTDTDSKQNARSGWRKYFEDVEAADIPNVASLRKEVRDQLLRFSRRHTSADLESNT